MLMMFKCKLSRFKLALLLIFLLALVLRLYHLNQVPPGFWFDESSFAYSAYSILKTGKDEFGQTLPVAFQAFGEYKMALYGYWLVPFITIFGLNVFSVRLASVVLSLLTMWGIWLVAKQIFKKESTAFWSAFSFAFMPAALQFNRIVYENNLTICLLVFGVYFFIKAVSQKKSLLTAGIFFSLSFYSHLLSRVVVLLILALLFWVYKKYFWPIKKLKTFVKPFQLIILGLILTPFLIYITKPQAWNRAQGTALWQDPGLIWRINSNRGNYQNQFLARVLHNKPLTYTQTFITNYLSHLTPKFWLFQGDPVQIYNTPGEGVILLTMLPFLCLGFCQLVKQKKPALVILGLLVISFIPAALTRFTPSLNRSFLLIIPVSLIIGLGIDFFWQKSSQRIWLKPALALAILAFLINICVYFQHYYVDLPKVYAYEWRRGLKPTLASLAKLKNNYQQVVVDQENINYISLLFFFQYPPSQVQDQAELVNIDEYGFGYIPQIDKYQFTRYMPDQLEDHTLYAGLCGDLKSKGTTLLEYNINQEKAFCLVEK